MSGAIEPATILVLTFIGYSILYILIGQMALRRGRGFWLWFIVALFLNPVVGLLLLLVLGERPHES